MPPAHRRSTIRLTREEFIERQVIFQLGLCSAEPGLDLVEFARDLRNSSFFFLHNPADGSFVPEAHAIGLWRSADGTWSYGAPGKNPRGRLNATFLNDVYQHGLRSPMLSDMANAIARNDPQFPVFQYNRQRDTNAILWPLGRIHDLSVDSFCTPPVAAEIGLREKTPTVFWRGTLVGMSRYRGRTYNIQNVIRAFVQGEIAKDVLLEHLGTIARYNFVSRYHGAEGFDVGFIDANRLAFYNAVPEIARYMKAGVSPEEQVRHRYLPCLRGNDVGSSFRWQVAAKSVILKESYPWEVFFDCHFRPGEHFVPIAEDFSDVQEKIAWCEKNLDECEAMNRRRAEIVPLLRDAEIRREALTQVLSRYADLYDRWLGR